MLTRAFLAVVWMGWAQTAAPGGGWHQRLYLGNDGYWRKRVAVTVRSGMGRAAVGEPVRVSIGRGAGQADLVGARAEAVRVCDAAGTEMLFDIAGPGGGAIRRGAIPPGASITVPIECAAGRSATYYVYFDNPSAWGVPDFLEARVSLVNGGLEDGTGQAPAGWRHDTPDADHAASWVSQKPHSGKRCLKTVVSQGAQPTWIATRQRNIHIIGGARYVLTAWVRGRNVKGSAGWYVHVGNEKHSQLLNRTLHVGDGTFDWRKARVELTAPQEANTASVGTVLWGTGTAWFDDVSLVSPEGSKLTASAGPAEELEVQRAGAAAAWYDPKGTWGHRAAVRVANFADTPDEAFLAYADLSRAAARLPAADRRAFLVTDGRSAVRHFALPEGLLFQAKAHARSIRTYSVYMGPGPAVPAEARGYAGLLESPANLARNPSFEGGKKLPADWAGAAEGHVPAGMETGLDEPGRFGRRCVRMHIPHGAKRAWTGWRQDVAVKPGRTYLYAAWLKTRDVRSGSVQLHAHYRDARGELCRTRKYDAVPGPLAGSHDWTLRSGHFEMPPDVAFFQLHLTMLATGTVWHDGVVLAEFQRGLTGPLEARQPARPRPLTVWPVNAVVKVFREDLPPAQIPAARITAARNEAEPLQLAVRSPRAMKGVRAEVAPPTGPGGRTLTGLSVAVVGYVPIDHPTSYYRSDSPRWHRKYPTRPQQCDGWAGMWPDPLLPRDTFDLAAGRTQPIWVTVSVPRDAAAGEYRGAVRLRHGGKTLHQTPFALRVWDFALPDASRVKAIYDVRFGPGGLAPWQAPGKTPRQVRREIWRFLAERRLCPDTIHPAPRLRYKDGRVSADFTEFDKAADLYFNELKLAHAYTPWSFYLFGWGHPPGGKFGQQPYAGKPPYEGADRGTLRPEFRQAYQACLKAFWQHVKAKGWADKIILYISDEPHFRHKHIVAQMKALCRMIHQVDPKIPIYSSTWAHVPQWDDCLDVWGIGHFGRVPAKKIAELKAAGKRILWTTDGQMCTDTPYCAIERLLPHYCLRYGAEGYEFWGVSWLTHDPYACGWHSYIHQSSEPGTSYWVRYPNGDGFLLYPGSPVGHDGPVSSVRLEQAREGVEDAEYLYQLRDLTAKAKAAGKDVSQAERALAQAAGLVPIPNAGGRYSTRILPNPAAVLEVKQAVARAIEGLKRLDR